VAAILKDLDYSLKANRKMVSDTYHPDRDKQFVYIAAMKRKFHIWHYPIISVDTKQKLLIGNFKNSGRIWCKEYIDVLNHDFRSKAIGIANPYGIFDLVNNSGLVVVGTSYDTAEFAVESIESWLQRYGLNQYSNPRHVLILCDSGGSNGYRVRLWKYALYHKLCCKYNISATVCHYPSGASKWNPIDHKLFSFISNNWQGVPLRSYATMLNYVRGTTTTTGLKVDAILNKKQYQKGLKITDEQMKSIHVKEHETLSFWNYTIHPN
jgi:hypothetical protein